MTDQWWGCYNDSWRGKIVHEAFAHPAKYARGLIRRIYKHCNEEGWLRVGDTVIDPFGGVALGGLDAMYLGLNWVGVELESHSVALGNQNIVMWNKQYSASFSHRGTAQLLQDDSSNLLAVVEAGRTAAVVSSPPYANSHIGTEYNPYYNSGGKSMGESRAARWIDLFGRSNYGNTPGNLGNMNAGDFDAAAHLIVEQTYAALRPGGHAVWVLKAIVRNKQIVDFPGQWRQLCETCSFVTLHEHHAMLVAETEQLSFDGKSNKRKEKKSFFRQMAESKGSPKIDYEVVLCMVK